MATRSALTKKQNPACPIIELLPLHGQAAPIIKEVRIWL